MPQGPFAVASTPALTGGAKTVVLTTAASTQVKLGAGLLFSVFINAVGAGSSVTFYDGTSAAGKLLAVVPSTALTAGPTMFSYAYTTGLFVVIAGTAPSVTVAYY